MRFTWGYWTHCEAGNNILGFNTFFVDWGFEKFASVLKAIGENIEFVKLGPTIC